MKTLHLGIIIVALIAGICIIFSQSSNAQMQNNSSTDLKCMDSITQDAKKKYASFDEEQAKTAAINYDKFKSEIKDDKYMFRAVSQEWTNDQVNCTVTLKDVLVLFFVTDSSGKQRDVTVIINPTSYMPQGIDVKYDIATHGGVESIITNQIDLPLKQFKSGISANNVTCNRGLELIFKSEDNSPACVKYNTAPKLTEQGWALTRLTIAGLKETYGVGEKIGFIIDYQGLLHYCSYPQVSVLDSNQNTIWKSQDINNMCVSDPFNPLPYVNQNFDLNSGYGGPIVINKTGTYTMVASLENQTASVEFTIVKQLLLPASFMPCDTPYPQSNTGVEVLYMPVNSTGKICVKYSNSNTPLPVSVRIFEAQRISQDTQDITVTADHDTIPTGNSVVAYTLKTTNQAGFYGFTIFCVGTPLAVGYDNSSTIVEGDFPWLGQMFMCPAQFYDYQIVGLHNIGVKYIP